VLGLCVLSLLSSVLARTTRLPRLTPGGWAADPGPGR
jgi:hypothetical protein